MQRGLTQYHGHIYTYPSSEWAFVQLNITIGFCFHPGTREGVHRSVKEEHITEYAPVQQFHDE